MASTVRSRRRATAIAVPGTVAVLLAGAFAAAPALAASTSPSLPFPSVCPSGQSASNASNPTSSASTGKSPTAKPTASADKSAGAASSTPKPSATPTTSDSASAAANAPVTTGSPSPSTSSSSSTGGDGFWGWLNGVWTWIFSDSPTSAGGASVQDAVAPLSGAHAVDAAAALGAREAGSKASPDCVSAQEAAKLAAEASASPSDDFTASTLPWVMKSPSMTAWNLTFNGVKTIKVWDPDSKSYADEDILDFTASSITITSMVTYSIQNGQTVFNNAGSGTTTTLTNPHLMVKSMNADLYGLIGQTYDPQHLPPLPVGLTVPLVPVIFTDVTTVIGGLYTDTITVPGFAGFASDGVASPE